MPGQDYVKIVFLLVLKDIVTFLPTYIPTSFYSCRKGPWEFGVPLMFFNSQISPACDVISTRYHVGTFPKTRRRRKLVYAT